jgi:hypothetical protein
MRFHLVLAMAFMAASCDRGRSDSPSETPPSVPAEGWHEIRLPRAKVALHVPEGSKVPRDRSAYEESFAGRSFRVVLPSGYDVLFAERHGPSGADVELEKRRYGRARGEDLEILHEAQDALVVRRTQPGSRGTHCEVTACSFATGHPVCAVQEGSRIDGAHVQNLTETECFAVVTIARSLRTL